MLKMDLSLALYGETVCNQKGSSMDKETVYKIPIFVELININEKYDIYRGIFFSSWVDRTVISVAHIFSNDFKMFLDNTFESSSILQKREIFSFWAIIRVHKYLIKT